MPTKTNKQKKLETELGSLPTAAGNRIFFYTVTWKALKNA
jgi:hypothetical protein